MSFLNFSGSLKFMRCLVSNSLLILGLLALALLLFLFHAGPAFGQSRVVTQSAGRTTDHVVTTREVIINSAVEDVLFRGPGAVKGLRARHVGSPEFNRELNSVLLEWAIYKEALTFTAGTVSQAEKRSAISRINSQLGGQGFWRAMEVQEVELVDLVDRKLRSKNFVNFKVESVSNPPSEAEMRSYFDSNLLQFEDKPFEEFRESIRQYLIRQNADRRLRDWYELLSERNNIRNFLIES